MAKKRASGISRRDFVRLTGTGALAAGIGPAFLFPGRAQAQQKTLKILQWSHFVPDYDKWFDGVYTKAWGQKHDTNVMVDHISLNEIPARAASEVAAQKGHDLVMFLSPPAAYEKQAIDHSEIYQEVERRHGKKITLAHRSTYNPVTQRFLRSRPRELAQGPLGGRRISEWAGLMGRLAGWRAENSQGSKTWQPLRTRPRAGTRHQHGYTCAAVVVWRRGAG
jgi:hypothetical protein